MHKLQKLKISSIAICLVLMGTPVIAQSQGDFHALNKLSANPTPMANDQLSSIEGGHEGGRAEVNIAINIAIVNQINICVRCEGDVEQVNFASITQINRNRWRN